jgi:hypothetical protein
MLYYINTLHFCKVDETTEYFHCILLSLIIQHGFRLISLGKEVDYRVYLFRIALIEFPFNLSKISQLKKEGTNV